MFILACSLLVEVCSMCSTSTVVVIVVVTQRKFSTFPRRLRGRGGAALLCSALPYSTTEVGWGRDGDRQRNESLC